MQAVLFDFHQTLFQAEDEQTWVAGAAASIGRPLMPREAAAIATRVRLARADPLVRRAQEGRDRSHKRHRAATARWLSAAGLDAPLADALYARLTSPALWRPYAEVPAVLAALRRCRIPVGLLSNTGWDLRPTLQRYDLADAVTAVILSCEHDAEKPDPELFRMACTALGASPEATLMIGDNPDTDGGAVRAGLPTFLLPPDEGLGSTRGLRSALAGIVVL